MEYEVWNMEHCSTVWSMEHGVLKLPWSDSKNRDGVLAPLLTSFLSPGPRHTQSIFKATILRGEEAASRAVYLHTSHVMPPLKLSLTYVTGVIKH